MDGNSHRDACDSSEHVSKNRQCWTGPNDVSDRLVRLGPRSVAQLQFDLSVKIRVDGLATFLDFERQQLGARGPVGILDDDRRRRLLQAVWSLTSFPAFEGRAQCADGEIRLYLVGRATPGQEDQAKYQKRVNTHRNSFPGNVVLMLNNGSDQMTEKGRIMLVTGLERFSHEHDASVAR